MIELKNLFKKSAFPSENGIKLVPGSRVALELTHEYLVSVLRYEPETGDWFWLKRMQAVIYKGDKAGTLNRAGYAQIKVCGKVIYSHVLAWFYMTGEWPNIKVEHENQAKNDNRWLNLRLATTSQNGANRGKQANNSSGWKGVCWDKSRKLFTVQVTFQGEHLNLGRFRCPTKAAIVYDKTAIKYFGPFACPNFPRAFYK